MARLVRLVASVLTATCLLVSLVCCGIELVAQSKTVRSKVMILMLWLLMGGFAGRIKMVMMPLIFVPNIDLSCVDSWLPSQDKPLVMGKGRVPLLTRWSGIMDLNPRFGRSTPGWFTWPSRVSG